MGKIYIYTLAIYNFKLSRDTQEIQFMTYPVPKFFVGDNVLVRIHTRDIWDPKYDVAYYVVHVMG